MTKAAFIVRNKFQLRQFDALADAFPGSDFLLYDRRGLHLEFSPDELEHQKLPVKLFKRPNISEQTGQYDVIFFQTLFPGIELLSEPPLVSVQYGLAKERHNYGEWRALADLNLMYGDYSVRQVAHFSPAVAVGNLKFCGWRYRLSQTEKQQAKLKLQLNPEKPVLLYMPTYGELGSFHELIEPLAKLNERYQVVIKGHHNDEMSGPKWMDIARALGVSSLYSGGADQRLLLEASDLVISDFSGAVFDAIYAEIPVILFQTRAEDRVGRQKFDLTSLEYRERERLGRVCQSVGELERAVEQVLASPTEYVARSAELRSELFVDVSDADDASMRVKDVVSRVISGDFPHVTKPQTFVRESIVRLLYAEQELRRARRRNIFTTLKSWATSVGGYLFARLTSRHN